MSSAAEVLRRMLDERDVEWKEEGPNKTKWSHDGIEYVAVNAWPRNGGAKTRLILHANITPEQAVAATLGARTCKVESMHGYTDAHTHTSWCVELSCHTLDAWEDAEPPNYCPICEARVVK